MDNNYNGTLLTKIWVLHCFSSCESVLVVVSQQLVEEVQCL